MNQTQIDAIVQQVLANLGVSASQSAAREENNTMPPYSSTEYNGRKLIGIYSDMTRSPRRRKAIKPCAP